MEENTFEDLLRKLMELKTPEAIQLSKKLQASWNDGVIPSRSQLTRITKLLKVDGPCARLLNDGMCDGWLKKHGVALGIIQGPPYKCPFVDDDPKKCQWRDCDGYREFHE